MMLLIQIQATMNKSDSNSKLNELLEGLRESNSPCLVRLSLRDGHHYLMDRVVAKVMNKREAYIEYKKIDTTLSAEIMQELHINKNPVLLLVKQGEIKAIFSGMVGQHQLEKAMQEANFNLGFSINQI